MSHIKYFVDLLKYQWQRIKAYPVRLVISLSWVVFGFIPQFFFWYIISLSTNTLPYSTKQIVIYFLFSMGLFYNLNYINDHFRRIATGDIVTNVIKPMSLTTNYFMMFFTTIFMNKLPNLIIIGIIGSIIISIKTTIFSFAFFILGLILGCMFFVVLFLAMFWFRNNWGIKWGVDIMIMFSSGTWIPLDIMPKALYSIVFLFPFHLMFFTPAKIFLGQYSPTFWLFGQYIIWIIVLYFIARILEYLGLKYYEQLGG